VLKVDDQRHVLALVPGDKLVNLIKIAKLEGAKQVYLAKNWMCCRECASFRSSHRAKDLYGYRDFAKRACEFQR